MDKMKIEEDIDYDWTQFLPCTISELSVKVKAVAQELGLSGKIELAHESPYGPKGCLYIVRDETDKEYFDRLARQAEYR